MLINNLHLFATDHDLRDTVAELKDFAGQYGLDVYTTYTDVSKVQAGVFIISHNADEPDQIGFQIGRIQKTYLDLVSHFIKQTNCRDHDNFKKITPQIFVLIRADLINAYRNWEKGAKPIVDELKRELKATCNKRSPLEKLVERMEEIYLWKKRLKFPESDQLKRKFDKICDGKQNNKKQIIAFLNRINKVNQINNGFKDNDLTIFKLFHKFEEYNELSLHLEEDGDRRIGLRRKNALLLYLFILNHLTNIERSDYTNNWYMTFSNVIDLKGSIRYALFPPQTPVDFHKSLTSGGLPVLAVSLQRFEWIADYRYELCFEVINAGKTPILSCEGLNDKDTREEFLQILDGKTHGPIDLPLKFAFGLPPALAAGESRAARGIVTVDPELKTIEYILQFRFRCIQNITILNRFVLSYHKVEGKCNLYYLDYCEDNTANRRNEAR